MRKWKFSVMLLLSIFVLGSLLAACGDKTSSDGGNDGNEGNESKDDLIHFFLQSSKKPDMDMYVEELREISGFNLDYDFIVPENYGEKLTVLFASGDLPDVIQTGGINDSRHKGAMESDAFLELGPLLEEHGPNILENIPDELWDHHKVSKDGKIYGIPTLQPAPNTLTTYIRQDWLDKLDMDVPETLDDWLAYYEGIKQNDMNDNGDPDDEYGYLMMQTHSRNDLFFGSFGVHPGAWHMKDEELTPDMITSEMKEAIAFYRDLYEEGYINPDYNTKSTVDWGADFLGGKGGTFTMIVNAFQTYGNPDEFDESDVEIALVPPPVGPNGDSGLGLLNDGLYNVFVIPEGTENPEEIIKYFDWAWSSEEADTFFSFGIEGHNYTVEDGEIVYDEHAFENTEDFMSGFFQTYMNPRGQASLSPRVVEQKKDGEIVQNGLDMALEHAVSNDGTGMPNLEAYSASPEIIPGLGEGTLFLEMFAKVVAGREELDPAFEKFVNEWKKRGGEEAIKEATEWYNEKN